MIAASISQAVWLGESRHRLTVINADKCVLVDSVFRLEFETIENQSAKTKQKKVKFLQDSQRLKLGPVKRSLGFDSGAEDEAKNESKNQKKKRQKLEREHLKQVPIPSQAEVFAHLQKLIGNQKVILLATKETFDFVCSIPLETVTQRKALLKGVLGCTELLEAYELENSANVQQAGVEATEIVANADPANQGIGRKLLATMSLLGVSLSGLAMFSMERLAARFGFERI